VPGLPRPYYLLGVLEYGVPMTTLHDEDAVLARRALGSLLRASDPSALKRLVTAMRASRGCIRAASAALGLGHEQTLYSIAKDTPAVREVLHREGFGRTGTMAYRRGERPTPRGKRAPQKKVRKRGRPGSL
jgi:hypothetical protein